MFFRCGYIVALNFIIVICVVSCVSSRLWVSDRFLFIFGLADICAGKFALPTARWRDIGCQLGSKVGLVRAARPGVRTNLKSMSVSTWLEILGAA